MNLPKKSVLKNSDAQATELINEQVNNGCVISTDQIKIHEDQSHSTDKKDKGARELQTVIIHDIKPNNESLTDNQTSTNPANQYHLFFDIRHILLHSSGSAAAKAVGVSNMFWYTVKHQKAPNHIEIQARLFEFMDYCTKQPRGIALFNNEPMPQLMCQWLQGSITAQELSRTILSYKTEIKEFFVSKEEQNLVLGAMAVFKPDVICQIQRPITKMVNFFQKCCKSYPNQIYILSNWDRDSASLIIRKFPQIFAQINDDHILLSGNTGRLKPEADTFNSITKKSNLDPAQCVLIDDMPENIRAAKELGWKTILYKNPDQAIIDLKSLLCQNLTTKPGSRKAKKHKHLES